MTTDDGNRSSPQAPPPAAPPTPFRRVARAVLRPVVVALATLYFLIDALFLWLIKPIANQLGNLAIFSRMRTFIQSLGPYPSLLLFLVPLIILEPVKPVAIYLAVKKHFVASTLVLVIGELLKITIVERLFHLNRDKLMTIRAFAVAYNFVMGWVNYLQALPPWQAVLRRFRTIKVRVRLATSAIKARVRPVWAAAKNLATAIKQRWMAFWADPA
jgi:hypothetical protein